MVDMGVLEAPAEWCGGSSPPLGTTTHGPPLYVVESPWEAWPSQGNAKVVQLVERAVI